MTSNHKLTNVLKGRTLRAAQPSGRVLTLTFHDGSTMTVKTATDATQTATGGTVKAVRQQGTRLDLDFEEGDSLEITTEEATSSVMVRDKNHALEYAD